MAVPLTDLTRKTVQLQWGQEPQNAFEELKSALSRTPVLMLPNYNKAFINNRCMFKGYGGVLSQLDDGCERSIAYHSRHLMQTSMMGVIY